MTVEVRRATPADTQALTALLAASYEANPKADPAVLRWQYWDNPFGRARSWVAEAGGVLVSHWAAIPVPLRVEGRVVLAAKGADIATHPDHRHRGLFGQVARALLDDLGDAGVEVLLTHPNPASAAAVERAGAVLVGYARAHVRPLDAAWLARRLRVPRALAGFGGRVAFPAPAASAPALRLEALPGGLDDLWARVEATHATGVVRDSSWWRWRYAQRPGGDYHYLGVERQGRLAGAAAVTVQRRYGGRFALVCELLAGETAAAKAIGLGVSGLAQSEGATGVAAVALPGAWQGRLLAAAGLRPLPRLLEPRPLRLMVAAPRGDAAALASRRWTMSWGDLDHL